MCDVAKHSNMLHLNSIKLKSVNMHKNMSFTYDI